MKISITLKDPDGVSNSVYEAVRAEVNKLGLDEDETEALFEIRLEKVEKQLEKWIYCDEYVTLNFDLDLGTAEVKTESRR